MSKVLVIEDQKDLYSMFDLILQFHGFEVTVVDNGQKAMEILKDGTPFDAITLDLHLPGVPGTEIYDMLEKRGDARHVLVVSAFIRDIKDFEIRGVNALEKPVKIEDLVERVTEIVEHKVPALQ
jgi:two-component system phosphate regulon response regulator PhoB